jgi:hypothetical protein
VPPHMQQFAVGGGESQRVHGSALGRQGASYAPMLEPTRRPPEMAHCRLAACLGVRPLCVQQRSFPAPRLEHVVDRPWSVVRLRDPARELTFAASA